MNALEVIGKVKLMIGEHEAVVKHDDPFKVLISTLLSQRTRDENTAKASSNLFSKYDNAKQLSKASLKDIERLIKPSGFYKVKAKRVKELAEQVVKNGMPKTFESLIKFHGVGRKTANCVLVYGYGIPAIPVDTHVHRIVNRVGLVKTQKPEQTEFELMKLVPKYKWLEFNDLFVKFGQRICKPLRPLCNEVECLLRPVCYYYKKLKK